METYSYIKLIITGLASDYMKDEFLTIREVSRFLKISETTIRNWIKRGKLPVLKSGRKSLVRVSDIEVNFKLHP
jgi:excisionase family DNA binding protein